VARQAANHRGLLAMEAVLTGILEAAGKPVLLIPGNHDTTPWAGRGQVRNIHGCRVDLGGWNFVGWRWAPPFEPAPPTDLQADLDRTARLVDRKTVLVSHNAPWGVLDRFFGCPAGSRPLAAMVRRQKPTWHLFGHFHSQFGRQGRRLNGCWPEAQAFWDIELGSGECRRVAAKVANLAGLVSWR
jgi:Icc-related predicted phosphoesterase